MIVHIIYADGIGSTIVHGASIARGNVPLTRRGWIRVLLCCVDLYVEAVLTTLGPGIFDWEAAGGGSSRETSVRQGRASSACQPQAQPVFPAPM